MFKPKDVVKLPQLIDVHVHARGWGEKRKGAVNDTFKAARKGGISTVCLMPNTKPGLVNINNFQGYVNLVNRYDPDLDKYVFVGGANAPVPIELISHPQIAGMKLYLTATHGDMLMHSFTRHVREWPGLLAIHADGDKLDEFLTHIVEEADLFRTQPEKRVHICHVNGERELSSIIRTREKLPWYAHRITCEVAQHHLLLNASDFRNNSIFGPNSVCPDIGDHSEFLRAHLRHVEIFASDHAPHESVKFESVKFESVKFESVKSESVKSGFIGPGFVGVDTLVPLLLHEVFCGRLTLPDLVERMHTNPLKIFGLRKKNISTVVNFEPNKLRPCFPDKLRNSPFYGRTVHGKILSINY